MRRAISLICLCLFLLTACKAEPSDPAKTAYTVTVKTEGGMPLEGVRVNVYDRADPTDLVWAAMTDADGNVAFQAANAALDAVLTELPRGYEAEERYALEGEQTVLTPKASLLDGALTDYVFTRGDMMCDFSVVAGDGDVTSSTPTTEYTLSELLKTKKAVVLNFWFENCGPCRAEFPYLQNAYKEYADDIEVLAINPYDGTPDSVLIYAANLGLTFPVMKGEGYWASSMNLSAYPTTVVIDRYGMIAMVHRGAVTEVGVFEKVFAFFTADDYVQQTVRNISELG
ncbi:MAG: redoxin domain-containing protein [Ruminococcaceae bacterium]|nr:redoxin domain-containing protein [Oscillospiraceae bacterium]